MRIVPACAAAAECPAFMLALQASGKRMATPGELSRIVERTSWHLRSWQVVTGVTVITSLLLIAEIPRQTWLSTATLSVALGASALALMGIAALLASRWSLVESALGGLDRVYLTHKWLAVWALVFASVHFVFRAELESWDLAPILQLPRPTTRFIRQLSFIALMVIVILALNRKIPYARWRLWHKFSGPLFVIVILHWLSIRSPVRLDSPAGIWLAAVSGLGVAGAAYKLLLYPFVAKHADYRVVGASADASALHLELEPVSKSITFRPGQFGFLRMEEDGLREPHPFTIAGGGQDGRVHFVIRDLGDYTHQLVKRAAPGMYAEVYAPYGRFQRPASAAREIWIAGGVGITPFIAWLTDPHASDFDRVTLFYFFTPGREFPKAEFLRELAARRGAQFVPVATGPSSAEFIERFDEIIRNSEPEHVVVCFCGPPGLKNALRPHLSRSGVPERNLRYEYFEFR
jgi:predicted ferric reductase